MHPHHHPPLPPLIPSHPIPSLPMYVMAAAAAALKKKKKKNSTITLLLFLLLAFFLAVPSSLALPAGAESGQTMRNLAQATYSKPTQALQPAHVTDCTLKPNQTCYPPSPPGNPYRRPGGPSPPAPPPPPPSF